MKDKSEEGTGVRGRREGTGLLLPTPCPLSPVPSSDSSFRLHPYLSRGSQIMWGWVMMP